jgi:excisionase family DNA binding protein
MKKLEDDLLTTAEVSALLGIPTSTLRWYRSMNKGPACFRLGRSVRYRRTAIQEWIESSEARSNRGLGVEL